MNLTDPGIMQRRTHILKLAFDGLDSQARELMARIAMIANAVTLDVLQAINPARPPKKVEEPGKLDLDEDDIVDGLREGLNGVETEIERANLELEIRDRQAGLKQEHEAALKAYKDYQNELIPARIKTDSWGDSQRRRSVHQFLHWESDLGSWGWRRRSR